MRSLIQQLPDHIANQIAAGEVIQRPASVVKELVENAVDAGATKITVKIKDAGKTLIQITDNGNGMSETDARMAFARHATSKIREAKDLFHLTTMGFRGEALASIAAISKVNLYTKAEDEELGTQLKISGSEVLLQEPTQCPQGCNFQIKNLFFNVPARRKFLKSDITEFKHINEEFIRIALTQPQIYFELTHNDTLIHRLELGNIKLRLINIFGKVYNDKLISVETNTTLGKISGYIGKTEIAKKSPGEQYFFVNNRFMRHPYFYKAVMMAFESLLQKGQYPVFFIHFNVEPESIDVNIHPTKTEIKFENEKALWQILHAAVKESIGRNNLTPSIDFSLEQSIEIPVASTRPRPTQEPEIRVNPKYNPFEKEKIYKSNDSYKEYYQKQRTENWESLYIGFSDKKKQPVQDSSQLLIDQTELQPDRIAQKHFFQLKQKYILSHVKSGLMVMDQKRAYERIVFEHLKRSIDLNKSSTQATLFPEEYQPNLLEADTLREILPDLQKLGFQISEQKGTFLINGIPGELVDLHPAQLLEDLISNLDEANPDLHENLTEMIASKLARISSYNKNKALTQEEMEQLTEALFSCTMPNYTPEGKIIIRILTLEEIDKLLTN